MKKLEDFYKEYRSAINPITGEQNLFKNITDQMIWDAAIKSLIPKGFHLIDKRTGEQIKWLSAFYFCDDGTIHYESDEAGEKVITIREISKEEKENFEIIWEF